MTNIDPGKKKSVLRNHSFVDDRGGVMAVRFTCTYTANLLAFRRPKSERGPAVLAIHAGVEWDDFYELPSFSIIF